MNSMPAVLARIPLFQLYRRLGWPRMLPMNLTLSPSPRCNSRCLTCNIWMKRENELTLDEWEKVLRSLGRAPYWFTVSGGEPLMYQGVVELCQMAYEHCRPGIINIPTNSILPSIPDKVRRIAESCPESQLIINLSLDGLGEKHDFIRGVVGNFEKFEHTLMPCSTSATACPTWPWASTRSSRFSAWTTSTRSWPMPTSRAPTSSSPRSPSPASSWTRSACRSRPRKRTIAMRSTG